MEFRNWFSNRAGLESPQALELAARSVVTSTGESDLEVTYSKSGTRTRVLVENKIDAAFQRRQAERYAERAACYVANRECEHVVTVLIAPASYIASAKEFNRFITYEDLREWFANNASGDARSLYKLHLLDAAISRGISGWVLVPNATAATFWRRYWELAVEVAPGLRMPKPGPKPATSNFFRFKPHELPKGVSLIHKVPYGNVDLQFAGQASAIDAFASSYERSLERGMSIATANKSLVVRLSVNEISLEAPFESVASDVRAALDAAVRLLAWYRRNVVVAGAT